MIERRILSLSLGLATLLPVVAGAGCIETRTASSTVARDLGAVPSAAARVCVLRPAAAASDVTMEVRDNGRLVAATRGLTFACWLAAPGEHQLRSVDDDTGPTYLHARAGKHYWLHQDVTSSEDAHDIGAGRGPVHAHLDWVDDSTATEMLRACDVRVQLAVPGYEERSDALAVTPKL